MTKWVDGKIEWFIVAATTTTTSLLFCASVQVSRLHVFLFFFFFAIFLTIFMTPFGRKCLDKFAPPCHECNLYATLMAKPTHARCTLPDFNLINSKFIRSLNTAGPASPASPFRAREFSTQLTDCLVCVQWAYSVKSFLYFICKNFCKATSYRHITFWQPCTSLPT